MYWQERHSLSVWFLMMSAIWRRWASMDTYWGYLGTPASTTQGH